MISADQPLVLTSYSALVSTAVHEAGHAVMALELGRGVQRVTMLPNDESLGVCSTNAIREWFRPDVEVTRRVRNLVECQVMISLAGPETEAAWLSQLSDRPRTWRRQVRTGAEPDLHRVAVLAEYVTGSEAEATAYVQWLTERCRNQMGDQYWWMVKALADELLKRRTLPGRDAREVVRQAGWAWLRRDRRDPASPLPVFT